MDRLNFDFEEKKAEKDDPVMELICESIELWEDNLRLFLDNERLRRRVEELEGIKRGYEEIWVRVLRG